MHYQLLHRTASALIEAQRFHAADAAMIVHSFSPDRRWQDAFFRFAALLGCDDALGATEPLTMPNGVRLILGWSSGDQAFRRA